MEDTTEKALYNQIRDLKSQLADTERERDEFCTMVVDLETKLLQSSPGDGSACTLSTLHRCNALEELVKDLERKNVALDAEREALASKCSDYRQECDQQICVCNTLTERHRKLEHDYDDLRERMGEVEREKTTLVQVMMAKKNTELAHLQEELARVMTESEANAEAIKTSDLLKVQQLHAVNKLRRELAHLQDELARVMTESEANAEAIKTRDLLKAQQLHDVDKLRLDFDLQADRIRALEKQIEALVHEKEAWTELQKESGEIGRKLHFEKEEALALLSKMRERCERTRAELAAAQQQQQREAELQLQIDQLKAELSHYDLGERTHQRETAEPQPKSQRISSMTSVPRTPGNIAYTPAKAGSINTTLNKAEAPKSEGRWQELRNIQTPDKWFKVPDVTSFSEATKKAQLALHAAEEELLKSTEKSISYHEPWTPPSLPRSYSMRDQPTSTTKSAKKESFQTNLTALLEDAASMLQDAATASSKSGKTETFQTNLDTMLEDADPNKQVTEHVSPLSPNESSWT